MQVIARDFTGAAQVRVAALLGDGRIVDSLLRRRFVNRDGRRPPQCRPVPIHGPAEMTRVIRLILTRDWLVRIDGGTPFDMVFGELDVEMLRPRIHASESKG